MRKLVLGLLLLAGPAFAQQPPAPPDPAMVACKQLLGNANEQTIQVVASMSHQIEALNAEVARLKAAAATSPAEEKPK